MKQYKALTFEVDLSGLGKEQWIQEELDYDEIAQKLIDELIKVMREKDVDVEASSNLIPVSYTHLTLPTIYSV